MRLRGVLLLIGVYPAAAWGQGAALGTEAPVTGSRLGNVGTLVQSFGDLPVTAAYSAEDANASRFTGYVAKCTADRKPALVDQYLRADAGSERQVWAAIKPTFEDCFKNYAFAMRYWGGISLQIPPFLLRGKLAEARLARLAAPGLATVSLDAHWAGPSWVLNERADHVLLVAGACIAALQPEPARLLLRTAPGSKAEVADTDAMLPEAGRRCVATGQTLRVSMSNLRAAIALGMYHRLDGQAVATEKN